MKRLAIALTLLSGCGRSDTYRRAPPPPVPQLMLDAAVEVPKMVTAYNGGFYNSDIGNLLDGTQPQLPPAESYGAADVTINPTTEPSLAAARDVLGDWL